MRRRGPSELRVLPMPAQYREAIEYHSAEYHGSPAKDSPSSDLHSPSWPQPHAVGHPRVLGCQPFAARLGSLQGGRCSYNWFTEGFDTRLLKEAKALLDELAS